MNPCEPEDTTAPVITAPGSLTEEATSAAGITVSFSVSAEDDVDGAVTPSCSRAPGTIFALGTTEVTCTATDAAGNTSEAAFDVIVQDTTPPLLTVPGDLSTLAIGAAGAAVSFSATSSDSVDPEAIEALLRGWITNRGVLNSLLVKLQYGSYGAFGNEAEALTGTWLTPEQAAELLALVAHL